MTASKRAKPRVGDEAWEVEWCSELAFYEDSEEVDRDECTIETRLFPTRDEALAFAAKIWPTTVGKFGIVEITPVQFVAYDEDDAARYPHVGYWEYTADGEVLSDDTGIPE